MKAKNKNWKFHFDFGNFKKIFTFVAPKNGKMSSGLQGEKTEEMITGGQ